jgi:hypothetical protein
MPLTYTGRSIKPDNVAHPSLIDIAVSLSRQPRFAGHCRRWWSVLDHTLFGADLLHADGDEAYPTLRLAWLLHDAHEAITGDIPTTFKTESMRWAQGDLDTRIHRAFYTSDNCWHSEVKAIDKRCLTAEAYVVGPPQANEHLEAFGWTAGVDDQWRKDSDVLRAGLARGKYLGIPPVTYPQLPTDHPGVEEYLARVLELL